MSCVFEGDTTEEELIAWQGIEFVDTLCIV